MANERESETKVETDSEKGSTIREYWVTLSVGFLALNSGMVMGWSGPALKKLLSEESPIPVTPSQGSWIVSLMEIGATVGTLSSTIMLNKIGRKPTLLICTIPMFISVFVFLVATTATELYAGRLLCGFTTGVSRGSLFLYIGEIASSKIRGKLVSLVFTQLHVGLLIEFITGSYLPFRVNQVLLIVPVMLFIVTFLAAPESPCYLLMKGDLKETRRSLEFLRRTTKVDDELSQLELFVQKDRDEKRGVLELIKDKTNRRSLFIIFGQLLLIRIAGNGVIMSYVQIIFQEVNTATSPELNSIIVVSTVFLASWICTYFIDSWGRKPLFVSSCIGVSFSLLSLGLYFYLKSIGFAYLEKISYLPLISLIGYKLAEGVGIGPIIHISCIELFPTNVKAGAVCATRIFQSLITFLVIQMYQVTVDNLGQFSVFWIFSFFSLLSAIFCIIYLPETKKQSLNEIQVELKK